ncbi:MAG: hypothetical protein JXR03_09310 [Cyclobacteriaceae bacterium]
MYLSYIERCRRLFQEGVTPSNVDYRNTDSFNEFLGFVKEEVETNGLESFYAYTLDGQYYINLWTSHFIIEFYSPINEIKEECLKIINRYANGKLNRKVADEEKVWLNFYSN